MTHWGWYWRIKKQYKPKARCCHYMELDSFDIFRGYNKKEWDKILVHGHLMTIPKYDLKTYIQGNGNLLIEYLHGKYIIPVERKSCNFGGFYYFFHCPLCSERMRKLYCVNGQFQCRICGRLAYYSQRRRPSRQTAKQYINLKKRIKDLGGDYDLNKKPPRMHRKTFEKLKDKVQYYDAKWMLAEINEVKDWHPKRATFLDGDIEIEAKYDIAEYENKYRKNKL